MEVIVYKDNVPSISFRGDNAENEAFIWLLKNQPQSTDWALRYGGFKVRVYPDAEHPAYDWQPYTKSRFRLIKSRPRKKK